MHQRIGSISASAALLHQRISSISTSEASAHQSISIIRMLNWSLIILVEIHLLTYWPSVRRVNIYVMICTFTVLQTSANRNIKMDLLTQFLQGGNFKILGQDGSYSFSHSHFPNIIDPFVKMVYAVYTVPPSWFLSCVISSTRWICGQIEWSSLLNLIIRSKFFWQFIWIYLFSSESFSQ